jgi:hypothetical protein
MAPIKPAQPEDAPFTLAIDRRILEGYLGNRRRMVEELGRVGISEAAITRRAEALGLSTSFLATERAAGVKPTIRQCLQCDQAFASFGAQNRLCKRCRQRA